uniref:insulin receptor-like n=1 Tax=Styela clava TaxID=7725 RepID=UPI001939DB84|nr:insulin receptor-like [Styela clava]
MGIIHIKGFSQLSALSLRQVYGERNGWRLLTLVICILLSANAADATFNDKLKDILYSPVRHGEKVARWNPDPATKSRVRRALATTTPNPNNDENNFYGMDYADSQCPEHLKYEFNDLFAMSYMGPVCDIIDARNDAAHMKDLENCTIVNGFVHLVFMHDLKEKDLKKYRFPKLRVITHYLLVFRMYNLRTLRYMFPNLAVIGGQETLKGYSLVLFENPHMTEIGLGNLQFINKGGVRIQKNSKLCYLSTIDWQRLGSYRSKISNGTDKLTQDQVVLKENQEPSQCVDQCGPNSGCDKVDGRELCWGLGLCQKRECPNHTCPPTNLPATCNNNAPTKQCKCHKQCLAGCTRPNNRSACIACRYKYHDGTCVSNCPHGTYLIHDWLCIAKEECQRLDWHFLGNVCRFQCPAGYQVEFRDCMRVCVKCTTDCGQVCIGNVRITDVHSLHDVEVCREIDGALDISINGGSEVVERLDDAFRDLEVIGTLIVRRSFPLVTLSFLKNIKRITGKYMEQDMYSVYILENQNLKELWDFSKHNTTIEGGKAFFHFNPHLCRKVEVRKVEELTPEIEDEKDISDSTNGDRAACEFTKIDVLNVEMFRDSVKILWRNFVVKDDRTLIGYQVYYKESLEQNAEKTEGVDACRLRSWKVEDKTKSEDQYYHVGPNGTVTPTLPDYTKPGNTSKLLSNLKAYTQYAYYIHAYTTSTAKSGAASDIKYFTTRPAEPTQPRNLRSTGTTVSSIEVAWDPPSLPNGIITHYIVEWKRQRKEDLASIREVNYCKHSTFKPMIPKGPTSPKPVNPETPKDEGTTPASTGKQECNCEKDVISKKDEENAKESSEFENYLQDHIFFPAPGLPEDFVTVEDFNSSSTRSKRSLSRIRRANFFNITMATRAINSTSIPTTTLSITNTTTPPPEDPEYMWQRMIVNKTTATLNGLHHFSDYDILVYACNHASDPQSRTLHFKVRESRSRMKFSNYTKCSIEAITMKRTSANHSVDVIPPDTVKVTNLGPPKEIIRLYWEMPVDPNAYVKKFTIEINSTEAGNNEFFATECAHVNTTVKSTMSYDFIPQRSLPPGSYSVRIRPVTLAGDGNWTAPVTMEISDTTKPGNSTTIIIVICVFIFFCFICLLAVLYYVKTRKKPLDPSQMYADMNPEYARYVYVPDEYEIDIEKVTILEEIGHGNFGKVFSGLAKSIVRGQEETKVAIKKLHENADPHRRFEFLKEASLMKAFNAHHVVRLLGVVSRTVDPLVIMEFMESGDLKSFLRLRRVSEEENSQHILPPTLQEKLQMAAEIADGMAYLADNKFVHRDLAARNCLVNHEGTVKIGDFGLTRDIYETDYYRKESRGFLPIRWMAPESLKDGVFDSRSDVWSYGVVLWELATLAEQPYQGQQHDEVTRFVIDGGYMERPRDCPKRLYDLMATCWQYNPKMRPIFLEIVHELYKDVNDEFKEVCFYGKQQDVGPGEEDQILLSDGMDIIYPHNGPSTSGQPYNDGGMISPGWNAGDSAIKFTRNNIKHERLSSTPPHYEGGDEKQSLLTPEPPQSLPQNEDYPHSGDTRSANTMSTTALTNTPPMSESHTRRNRNSSDSSYENDYEDNLSPPGGQHKTDQNLRDSGAFTQTHRSPKSEGKDPLISYKHLNGGHKSKTMELDLESGVEEGTWGNSSTASASNPSTPTETQAMLSNSLNGHNKDSNIYPVLRPPASSGC